MEVSSLPLLGWRVVIIRVGESQPKAGESSLERDSPNLLRSVHHLHYPLLGGRIVITRESPNLKWGSHMNFIDRDGPID